MKFKDIQKISIIAILIVLIITTPIYAANNTVNSSGKNVVTGENSKKKGLEKLQIGELKLDPEFKTENYEYTINYKGEESVLQIDAIPTESHYTVEIIGNKDLKDGENLITILVKGSNGENEAIYQLNVNKNIDGKKTKEDSNNLKNIIPYIEYAYYAGIVIGIIAGIVVMIIIMKIIKKRKKKERNEDYNENDYEDRYLEDQNNYYDYDEDDIPKALKNKKTKGKRYK
ncbi:MAG: hypothetical protein HUJ68_00690 [Clostridia bacterium]|nr:hypothetical protein [Clostridia bacterium]